MLDEVRELTLQLVDDLEKVPLAIFYEPQAFRPFRHVTRAPFMSKRILISVGRVRARIWLSFGKLARIGQNLEILL